MSETEVSTEAQIDDTDNLDTFSADFFGRKPAEAETTNSEVVQDSTEEAPVADTEAQKTEVDPNEDPDAEFKEAPPKKKTVQDRIDELVRQREDAKRESAIQIDQLRKEMEELKNGATPKPAVVKSNEPAPDDLTEDGTPKYALGEFDPQYIRDLTRHTLAEERTQAATKAEQERQTQEVNQAARVLVESWNGKLDAVRAEYPDLQEKGQELLNRFGNLNTDYASYLSTVLMSMDKGPEVLYYLSNNPEEAVQIVNSGAQKATLALGRIESKFLDADAQKQLAKPKVSQAPAPPPASTRARGTNGAFVAVAPDTDDLDAFAGEFFKSRK